MDGPQTQVYTTTPNNRPNLLKIGIIILVVLIVLGTLILNVFAYTSLMDKIGFNRLSRSGSPKLVTDASGRVSGKITKVNEKLLTVSDGAGMSEDFAIAENAQILYPDRSSAAFDAKKIEINQSAELTVKLMNELWQVTLISYLGNPTITTPGAPKSTVPQQVTPAGTTNPAIYPGMYDNKPSPSASAATVATPRPTN